MDTFADYILEERDLASKMEIVYYLAKKNRIFFDKSVIFKTEIARMFLNYSKIEVDKNLVLTAALLCNVKKVDNAQDIEGIHTYAKKGADYLSTIGFNKRFCKICEEVNRYSNSNPRERESDILELIDQFGGMLLDRPERIGFQPDEAMVLLEHRNLKGQYNRFLHTFGEFVQMMEKIELSDLTSMKSLRRLVKIHNESENIKTFIKKVCYDYDSKIDKAVENYRKEIKGEMFKDANRPLFSEETTRKILAHIAEENIQGEKLKNENQSF